MMMVFRVGDWCNHRDTGGDFCARVCRVGSRVWSAGSGGAGFGGSGQEAARGGGS